MAEQQDLERTLGNLERILTETTNNTSIEECKIVLDDARRKFCNLKSSLDQDKVNVIDTLLNQMTTIVDQWTARHSHDSATAYQAQRPKLGARGRPKIEISRDELVAFNDARYTGKKMAEHFNCSPRVVYNRLKEEGLNLKNRYSDMSDQELDTSILELKQSFPKAGSQMMHGYLLSRGINVQRQRIRESLKRLDPEGSAERWSTAVHRRVYHVPTPNSLWHMDGHMKLIRGINVQRQRIRESLKRLDPEGSAERWSTAVHRRVYHVPTPNSLWHMDGHMKLIRWGFSTHGCVDGYSRLITFLQCGLTHTSSTVLRLFVQACAAFGVPSRVRSDHGGENTKVALFLNLIRGRSSHITGKSVHNERIERLWRDVHYQVTSVFYQEFYQMEDDPEINLNPDDDRHRAALQYIYLPVINNRLEAFQRGWNQHKIRSANHKSPHQLWLSGMLDNMGSGYTATLELFGQTPNLEESLESGLARFGLNINDIDEAAVPQDVSQGPMQLTDEQHDILNRQFVDVDTNQNKFLKVLEFMEVHNL